MSLSARLLGAALVNAVVIAVAIASVTGCHGDSSAAGWVAAAEKRTDEPSVVAMVNGTPITAADLALAMTTAARASNPHAAGDPAASPPVRDEVLDRLIGEELAAQRAHDRGLDADPGFQDELAVQKAQVDGFRRQRLAMMLARDVRAQVEVTEAEARRFFAQHSDRIRTATRVSQILLRDRAAIEAARRDLDAGAAFEVVAARQFPDLPAGTTPWNLGELAWHQIPEMWQAVLGKLAIGATSPIIEGPRGRLWIIKLVGRRVDPAITFETARPAITTLLGSQAAEAAQAELERTLRAGATISRAPHGR